MYLVEIDEFTKMVKDTPSNSGWKAIEEFSELSIKQFTLVALFCDHLSPFRYYSADDRFAKCCEEIYNDRYKYTEKSRKISKAIAKYNELQYNPDLEFLNINRDVRLQLILDLREANIAKDYDRVKITSKLISENKKMTDDFMKDFDMAKAIDNSVTENGYELSRIEIDIKTRKNSKFVDSNNAKNPNKLKL